MSSLEQKLSKELETAKKTAEWPPSMPELPLSDNEAINKLAAENEGLKVTTVTLRILLEQRLVWIQIHPRFTFYSPIVLIILKYSLLGILHCRVL